MWGRIPKCKCASVTMSVMCEWGVVIPQATSSVDTETQAKRDCNSFINNSLGAQYSGD